MNRRDFLRSTAAAGAAVVVAPLAICEAAPSAHVACEAGPIFGTGMPTLLLGAQRDYDECMREAMRQAMLMRERVRWEIFSGNPSKILP